MEIDTADGYVCDRNCIVGGERNVELIDRDARHKECRGRETGHTLRQGG